MIEWTKIDQPRFDRIVETLILRNFRSVAQVEVVDGRGGDDGIDILVTHRDGSTTIYQLKYFPEGFSGGFAPRRSQVKRSYRRAVRSHSPTSWKLVVPRNLIPSEKKFLAALTSHTPEGFVAPAVAHVGRAELDQLLVDFPEVDRWLTRDHLREAAEIFNRERDLLLGGSRDLGERVSTLGSIVDSVDPDWTLDFERRGDSVVQTLRAVHPDSAERSPIAITMRGTISRADEHVHAAIQAAFQFGSFDGVEIPERCISELVVTGSELVAGTFRPDRVVLTSLPVDVNAVGKALEIRFFASDDSCEGAYDGVVSKVLSGTLGFTNEVEFFSGHLTLRFVLPLDGQGESHSVGVRYDLDGLNPRDVAAILEFRRLISSCSRVETLIDGHELAKFSADEPSETFDESELLEFARDLAAVYEHCNVSYLMPDSYTGEDRVNARVARLLIEGFAVASPQARSFTAQLTSEARLDDGMKQLLTDVTTVRFGTGYAFSLCSRTFDLGTVWVFHPAARAENGDIAAAAIEAGTQDGFALTLRPKDDPFFYVYLPSSPTAGDTEFPKFHAWGLDEIEEPWMQREYFERFQTVA